MKKIKRTDLIKFIAVVLIMLFVSLAMPYISNSSSEVNTNLFIRKLQYNDDLTSDQYIKNTGKELVLPEYVKEYDKSKYGDVGFSLYKVKDNAYTLGEKGNIVLNTPLETLVENLDNSNDVIVISKNVLVDNKGVSKFANTPKGLYIVAETKTSEEFVAKKAEPMLIQLPVFDEAGQIVNVSLYPKNKVKGLTFTLKKVNENNKPLDLVYFDMYKGEPGSGTLIRENLVTDEKGEIKATDLTLGKYYFVEKEKGRVTTIENGYKYPGKYILSKEARNDQNNKLKFEITKTNIDESKLNATIKNYKVPRIYKSLKNAPVLGGNAEFEVKVKIPDDAKNPNDSIIVGGTNAATKEVNKYTEYKYKDTYTGFVGKAKNIVIKIDDIILENNVDYKIELGSDNFNIDFIVNGELSNKVKSNAGKNIVLTYELVVPESIENQTISNNAKLFYAKGNEKGKNAEVLPGVDEEPKEPWMPPESGNTPDNPGYVPEDPSDNPYTPPVTDITLSFYKATLIAKEYSIFGTGKVLSGAQFKLQDTKTKKYLATANSSDRWTTKENARIFETDTNGKIVIEGLSNAEYNFVEVKAPEGYIKGDRSIPILIWNQDEEKTVYYEKQQGLPITGSDVVIMTIITGVIVLGVAYIFKRKESKI